MSVNPAGPSQLETIISLEEAINRINGAMNPIERVETVELQAAVGRILAATISAPDSAPSHDRSRMDGFAVRLADFEGLEAGARKVLSIAGKVPAGSAPLFELKASTCAEVATGAWLPIGTDAVIPVEEARVVAGDQMVEFEKAPARGAHISLAGSDYRGGDPLIEAGALLTPGRIAAAAACNMPQIEVVARPKVLIVSTGDELFPLGAPLTPGKVRDTNAYGLAAFVLARGGAPDRHPIVRDSPEDLAAVLGRADRYDAVVFTGGTSAGARDFLAPTLMEAGDILFHGVRIRPGRPVLFGLVGTTPVLGLPGNPTSCLVDAHLLLSRMMWGLLGCPAPPTAAVRVKLDGDIEPHIKAGPSDFLNLVLVRVGEGRAVPVVKDSMTITGASHSDGFIPISPGRAIPKPGDDVTVVPFL